jgi:hypothetical protein
MRFKLIWLVASMGLSGLAGCEKSEDPSSSGPIVVDPDADADADADADGDDTGSSDGDADADGDDTGSSDGDADADGDDTGSPDGGADADGDDTGSPDGGADADDTGTSGDTGGADDTGTSGDTGSADDTGTSGDTGSADDTGTSGDTGSMVDTGASDGDSDSVFAVQSGLIAEGEGATLTSVVVTTIPKFSSTGQGFWIQDAGGGEYSGVRVYVYDTTDIGITEGTILDMEGTVAEFYDLTQIQLDSVDGITLDGETSVPTVNLVDPDAVVDWEVWEGALIQLEDIVVGADEDHGEFSITMGDSEEAMRIDDMIWPDLAEFVGTGDTIESITGLMHYSYDSWKLEVRGESDFIGYEVYVPAPEECTADICMADAVVGDVVISEIMFNPHVGTDSRNEWVEVRNNTAGTINLKGLTVTDADGGAAELEDDVVVEVGGYAVLAVSDGTDWAYVFTASAHYGSLSLGNGGDEVSIEFDGIELDWVPDYGSLGISAGNSFMLDGGFESTTDNDSIGSWCEAGVLEADVIGDTTDNGTPFAMGTCFAE